MSSPLCLRVIISEYPDIELVSKARSLSKDIRAYLENFLTYLIVPSQGDEERLCLIKASFLLRFPKITRLVRRDVREIEDVNASHGSLPEFEDNSCHVVYDIPGDIQEGICNIRGIHDIRLKIESFDNEDRVDNNMLILKLFVNICEEGTKLASARRQSNGCYVIMDGYGISSMKGPFDGEKYNFSNKMIYEISTKTLYDGDFGFYNMNLEGYPLPPSSDKDGKRKRYERYLTVLSKIDVRCLDDTFLKFLQELSIGTEAFKNLEGVVVVDFYEHYTDVTEDMVEFLDACPSSEIARKYLDKIKHYYLLPYRSGRRAYINDDTAKGFGVIAERIYEIYKGPAHQVLTFPYIVSKRSVLEIFPNLIFPCLRP